MRPPPPGPRSSAFRLAAIAAFVLLAIGIVHASGRGATHHAAALRPGPPLALSAAVGAHPYGRPVPSGFLGLSMEYQALESYAGTTPAQPNPTFVQLVRNLTAGQAPVLRIGGDSADWTWWPVSGLARPRGVTYALDERWLEVAAALQRRLGAQLILGLNLEANSQDVAGAEARALLGAFGEGPIAAFELGNEPSIYGQFPWYRTRSGRGVPGRPASYGFADFLSDFGRIAAALPLHALAGPSTGGLGWLPYTERFLAAEPAVRMVTVHRYPLQLCVTSHASGRYPTIPHLLAPAASRGLAGAFAATIAVAHARGLPLRIDELNSVSCGADPAVSRTFASALWALDTLFAFAAVGADGVQIHTFPGAGYELFEMHPGPRGPAVAVVEPDYYGLLAFAAAAPPGTRLLPVTPALYGPLRLWAGRTANGHLHVVVINTSPNRAATVHVGLPATAPGRVALLSAPALDAATGITWGGRTFAAPTSSGRLQGALSAPSVVPQAGTYTVTVPAASAALLTVG